MKKSMLIILMVLLLCGCTAKDAAATQAPADSGQPQPIESEPTPEPEPTPVPSIQRVALPANVSDYGQFLTHVSSEETPGFVTEMETPIESLVSSEDDACYVEFNPDRMSNLQLDRPTMPTYTWYINGSNTDKISEVVIEFDLLETIHPLHPGFF